MQVLLYGRLRDGAPIEDMPDSIRDLDSFRDWLAAVRPELIDDTVRIAVNDVMVNGNCPLCSGDEIALLPPVSGG